MDMGTTGALPNIQEETIQAGDQTLSTQVSIHDKAKKKTGVQKKAPSKELGVKKRVLKRRSWVWKHYNVVEDKAAKTKTGFCKYCNVCYDASSKAGTSNFSIHLESCSEFQKLQSTDGSLGKEIDQKVFRRLLAEALMRHGYSFSWVEHEGTRKLFKYLNDGVESITRNTIQKDCLEMHAELKEKIMRVLRELPGRICLTSDLWTACTSRGYMCVTAHYIDDNWELHSKLLSFRHCAPPHGGYELSLEMENVILDWGIDQKIFSLTIDNASNMDRMVVNLKSGILKDLPAKGKLFHIRCAAHILNLIVKKGLKVVDHSISKLREGIKYIDGSEARKIKFHDLCKKHIISFSGGLWLDVPTRWNSTYIMLERALKYRDALANYFVGMDSLASKYHLGHDEWLKIEKICGLLEPFYEITKLFSGTDYPTANLYFPQVFLIRSRLMKAIEDGLFEGAEIDGLDVDGLDVSFVATEMLEKFKKYWDDYVMVLSFAVIFDPRKKFGFVKFALMKTHGEEEGGKKAKEVYMNLDGLFKEYQKAAEICVPSGVEKLRNENQIQSHYANLEEFELYDPCDCSKTELDKYLDETRKPSTEGFCVLSYWKENSTSFPIVASMARDILAIPITSVASESTFSRGGRILNKYRSSLTDENVDILVTTNNWLTGYDDFSQEGISLKVPLDDSYEGSAQGSVN